MTSQHSSIFIGDLRHFGSDILSHRLLVARPLCDQVSHFFFSNSHFKPLDSIARSARAELGSLISSKHAR
jgi:hypothetical protein